MWNIWHQCKSNAIDSSHYSHHCWTHLGLLEPDPRSDEAVLFIRFTKVVRLDLELIHKTTFAAGYSIIPPSWIRVSKRPSVVATCRIWLGRTWIWAFAPVYTMVGRNP